MTPEKQWLDATTLHVRRSREGDPSSLAWLVERFTPLLLAQARHRLGRHLRQLYDPEDLVQEAWGIALPRLAELRPASGRLTPVLLRFLSTTLLHRYGALMQKHVLGKPLTTVQGVGLPSEQDALACLPAEQTSVVSRAAHGELCARILGAIEGLPEKDREVIVLRSIEQVSLGAAADILGVTENHVAVRHHRALRHLRAALPDSILHDLAEP